jgi:hypothetical protein
MPHKDPEKRREATRERVRRHRARKGVALDKLADDLQDVGGLPEPPSREFLLKALGMQAREGNVPAIRLLLEEYRRDGDSDDKPAADPIDELAKRRTARAG